MERFFDYYILVALGCFFCLIAGHAIIMRAKGVEMKGANRPQTTGERIEDFMGGVLPALRFYETIAYAWPINFHIGPPFLGKVLIGAISFKVAGVILWMAALVLYAFAHWTFGTSWRLQVGSNTRRRLITCGPFAYSRNPIYVSFILMTVGTFLILGQLIFLLIVCVSIPLLHKRILREEQFLASTTGEAYREYCSRVPRYVMWN